MENKEVEVMEPVDTNTIDAEKLKEHQKQVDKGIRVIRDEIKELSDTNRKLRVMINETPSFDAAAKYSSIKDTNALKISHCLFILDKLKSFKNFKLIINHSGFVSGTTTLLTDTNNRELNAFIKYLNERIENELYAIPDDTKINALTNVKCGLCGNKTLTLYRSKDLILEPIVPVVCRVCSTKSAIEFKPSDTEA